MPRPVAKRISARYVAGGTLDPQGCAATIDLLGESTEDRADVAATLRMYKRVLDALGEDLDSGVSVKLTASGLTLDESAAPPARRLCAPVPLVSASWEVKHATRGGRQPTPVETPRRWHVHHSLGYLPTALLLARLDQATGSFCLVPNRGRRALGRYDPHPAEEIAAFGACLLSDGPLSHRGRAGGRRRGHGRVDARIGTDMAEIRRALERRS
jgi:hypothetical protein